MTRSILFLGATGYIGTSVLSRLLTTDPSAHFTLLDRDPTLIPSFNDLDRITAVEGSLDDTARLEELAGAHDVVVNCADADGLDATRAILRGLKRRKEVTGVGVLVHTSGTGCLADDARGAHPTTKIYTDASATPNSSPPLLALSSLPATAFHRDVDLAIVRADAAGHVRGYIVLPSTIYGISRTPFTDKGLANAQSAQVPYLVRMSLARGAPAVVGAGENVWGCVHVDDCADLYALVYKTAITGDGGEHGTRGYYFAENGEYTLRDAAVEIGKVLEAKGLGTKEPRTLDGGELEKYLGGSTYLGSNSRARGVRSRAIGWTPTHPAEDLFPSIADDVEYALANKRGKDKDGNWVWAKWPVFVDGKWQVQAQ